MIALDRGKVCLVFVYCFRFPLTNPWNPLLIFPKNWIHLLFTNLRQPEICIIYPSSSPSPNLLAKDSCMYVCLRYQTFLSDSEVSNLNRGFREELCSFAQHHRFRSTLAGKFWEKQVDINIYIYR